MKFLRYFNICRDFIFSNAKFFFVVNVLDYVLVYVEEEKALPPRHAEFRRTFLENLAKSQLEFEEV